MTGRAEQGRNSPSGAEDVRFQIDLSAAAVVRGLEKEPIEKRAKFIHRLNLTEPLEEGLLVQKLQKEMPTGEKARFIYGLYLAKSLDDHLFQVAYTKEELKKLMKDKKKQQILEDRILDTEDKLYSKVLFKLRIDGLEDLKNQEEDLNNRKKLQDKLDLLESESPYRNYTEEESEEAASLGRKKRWKIIHQIHKRDFDAYKERGFMTETDHSQGLTHLQQRWQEDQERVWWENQDAALWFLEGLDDNSLLAL